MLSKTSLKTAWVTVLTRTNQYVAGVLTLKYALDKLGSAYPLLILHTSAVTEDVLDTLRQAGCLLRQIEPIRPKGQVHYLFEHFSEIWTKLAAWDQDDYDRLVLLDSDMLPLQNLDELMTLPTPDARWVLASHACVCNPQKIKTYPASWIPSNCMYTYCDSATTDFTSSKSNYFNSGLVVFTPSKSLFNEMLEKLHQTPDPSVYKFGDQDLLNEIFESRWTPISYVYNALKTLCVSHKPMWVQSKVKNVHYILSKPWEVDMENPAVKDEPYMELYRLWWESYHGAISRINGPIPDVLLLK
ncbi:hypothetical protein EC973_001344 [Apophysomyces ossiformis]|uniref:Nucleotide-diphospho-sugar transferase n=1 Tax=Apophysomyces ossiformis TaxID=679940 RepID=A0A8H7BY04_9FUNG|nr:hypothetical protein EC973_001344 [Apophysomyces ossiformis]